MSLFLRKSVVLTLLALCLFAATASFAEEAEQAGEAQPEVPVFTLKALDGKEYSLEERRGKPLTIVTFIATWNPRSVTILKELAKLEEKLVEKGVITIAVNAESEVTAADFPSVLDAYVKEHNVTLPVLLDPGLNTYRAWNVKALPTTFLLDTDLKVIKEIPGAPSTIHEMLFDTAMKALGMEVEKPNANMVITRYQAARDEMLNYGLADRLLHRGSPHKALEKIITVVEKDEKFPDAFALKGIIHLSISEEGESSDNARAAFAKALELDPNLPAALFGASYFAALDGDSQASLAKAKEALSKTAWGFHKPPTASKMAIYKSRLDKAEGFLANGDIDNANVELGAVLEDFVVYRRRVKVDMKRMKEMAKKAEAAVEEMEKSQEEEGETPAGEEPAK